MSAQEAHDHTHNHDHGHHGHAHDEDGHCTIEKFNVRDLIVREDIMDRTKQLANLISTSEEVIFYRKAEQMIKDNKEVQDLIKLIKKRQKEAVAFESFQNQKMVDKINGEIEALQDQLDGFPVVEQFKQAQEDINYLLQMVVSVVRDTVSDNIKLDEESVASSLKTCSD
ncbi:RicAFT regulatory complex protein RicA family protein [Paenibacillus koleovorans]|uniref:RicAFT regulatory complex protein RicA family protein n=1 Tax=Paenibacillus koleovorans TaxID=121608 RepID=UPI000FD72BCA|nr:YlbF family regulator [Paenibacillus koleovorans]